MNILIIHNSYGKFSGEEAVVQAQIRLLREHGHDVDLFERSSEEIPKLKGKEITAFFSGFYNQKSIRSLKKILVEKRFDIVHIHNLYPLISPSILPIIKKRNFEVLKFMDFKSANLQFSNPAITMTVHNYRLLCPNGLFFTHKELCHSCTGGLREFNCIVRNCERSPLKSTGYALRNRYARLRRLYLDNVDHYICLTRFQKDILGENGFQTDKISVIPNTINADKYPTSPFENKEYAGFAGRVNYEKGAHLLFRAAEISPMIPFRLAGTLDNNFLRKNPYPSNVTMTGQLRGNEMSEFYDSLKFLVVPSVWYEGFPMVTLEAMKHSLAIIAPNHGGFPEIIEDGVNGLLFEPGNADDLSAKIRLLWEDKGLCGRLGQTGNRKLETDYSESVYYTKLMEVYEGVLDARC